MKMNTGLNAQIHNINVEAVENCRECYFEKDDKLCEPCSTCPVPAKYAAKMDSPLCAKRYFAGKKQSAPTEISEDDGRLSIEATYGESVKRLGYESVVQAVEWLWQDFGTEIASIVLGIPFSVVIDIVKTQRFECVAPRFVKLNCDF
jgi:hypothetical protein